MLDAGRAERALGLLYSAAACTSVTSTVALVVAWQHWAWTLDTCIDVNCGCILYGVKTFSSFVGGDVKLCHFTSYGLLPPIIIGLCLGFYHGYRACIPRSLSEPKSLAQANRMQQSR